MCSVQGASGAATMALQNTIQFRCAYPQGPAHNQMHVAHALGIPGHKVVARTKRLGGGFGGKETRAVNVSCAAAVPAFHTRRPVRLILDRDEDMHTSGHRHAFIGHYKVRALDALSTQCRPVPTRRCLEFSTLPPFRVSKRVPCSSEAFGNITVPVHGSAQHPPLCFASPVSGEFIPPPENYEPKACTAARI